MKITDMFHSDGVHVGVGRAVSGVAGSVVKGESTGGGMDEEVVNEKARSRGRQKAELRFKV
jgi:hypothetical protein